MSHALDVLEVAAQAIAWNQLESDRSETQAEKLGL